MTRELLMPLPHRPDWPYAILTNAVGQFCNTTGPTLEPYNSANWANYAHAATQLGDSIFHAVNMDAVPAGMYRWWGFEEADHGVGPSETADEYNGYEGWFQWDGTAVVPLSDVDTTATAIKAKTDNLPTDPADQSAVEAAITAATAPLSTAVALQTVDDLVDDLEGRLTAARAGYLDNLNVGGAVASQADVNALNQSASRRVVLVTVPQYERPTAGNNTYTVEARTYDGDGAAVNADSTPTLTATGIVSGDLSANLSVASNPATGVYRWTYTLASGATLEQIRMDLSATISAAVFTISAYTQAADFVAATFTTTDQSNLTAIFNKLPSKSRLTGSDNASGDVEMDDATGNYPGSVGSVVGAVGSVTGNVGGNVTGSIGSLATQAKADVNAEADAALADIGATSARMGYLNNLNIGGNVASSTEVTSIQNNTRVVRVVPDIIKRPDAGTTTYRIELLLYDTAGNMETPDSAPTIALVNQIGTDRSSRLDSVTMALVSPGRYRAVYTSSNGDALEQLVWTFSVVEGGITRLYGNTSLIEDISAGGGGDDPWVTDLPGAYTPGQAGYILGNLSGSSPGLGAVAVTVTIEDEDGDPIEAADVTLVINSTSRYVDTTDVTGVAELTPTEGNGTYTVLVRANGYHLTPQTLVVAGDTEVTYTMTALNITASPPGQVTGYLYCYDEFGVPESGVVIYLKQVEPVSGQGVAYDGAVRPVTSDSDGLVEFTGLFQGARYYIYRTLTDARPVKFSVDSDQTDPMELPSIISRP